MLIQLFFLFSIFNFSLASRRLTELVQNSPTLLNYHDGALLSGDISVNFIYYGTFKPSQKAIISDFITSLNSPKSPKSQIEPSVATWWKTTEKYKTKSSSSSKPLSLRLGKQISDPDCSLGKSLTNENLVQLASKGEPRNAVNAVNVVLTASDVAVTGFCSSRCGTHGSSNSKSAIKGKNYKFAYIWVGNSETQCPGHCAWPFHQPIYGPQAAPLIAPNNDVGLDGTIL